jgi:hypothetical protein
MEVIDQILSRFSHRDIVYFIEDPSEKLEYMVLDVLIPWRYKGEKSYIAAKFFIGNRGVVVNLSINKDKDLEVYIGDNMEEACNSVIRELWRFKVKV